MFTNIKCLHPYIFQFPQGDIPPPIVPPPMETTVWSVKAVEKTKYDGIFLVRIERIF
jgi:hypothetical protein